MKSLFIILFAIVFANGAQAGENHNQNNGANASSHSSAHAVGVGVGVAKASSGGNTQSVGGDDAAASSAIAPGLVANGCMGSSSAAGQGMGFGVSLGTTWKDPDCIRMRKAMDLDSAGHKRAAMAIRCQDPEVLAAMRYEDVKCPQDVAKPEAAAAPVSIVATKGPREECAGFWCYKVDN